MSISGNNSLLLWGAILPSPKSKWDFITRRYYMPRARVIQEAFHLQYDERGSLSVEEDRPKRDGLLLVLSTLPTKFLRFKIPPSSTYGSPDRVTLGSLAIGVDGRQLGVVVSHSTSIIYNYWEGVVTLPPTRACLFAFVLPLHNTRGAVAVE
ncbi:hypothetical protein GHT06_017848 [Daphnia sinensis]|uniref:Uncharacterized protein n=1 Tax=Daphnia sinensis TaxID=1820382 RepID=A0AAD5LCV3_9CRUS|nr:hypothetical protein GHT06_017848 [Daphnia sinensis]